MKGTILLVGSIRVPKGETSISASSPFPKGDWIRNEQSTLGGIRSSDLPCPLNGKIDPPSGEEFHFVQSISRPQRGIAQSPSPLGNGAKILVVPLPANASPSGGRIYNPPKGAGVRNVMMREVPISLWGSNIWFASPLGNRSILTKKKTTNKIFVFTFNILKYFCLSFEI